MTETGVWFVVANGNVATLSVLGVRSVATGQTSTTGQVTERPPKSACDLPPVDDLAFAGHDVRSASLVDRAESFHERNGIPDRDVLEDVRGDDSIAGIVEWIGADVRTFEDRRGTDRVVVVNVASTEPPPTDPDRYDTLDSLGFDRLVAYVDEQAEAPADEVAPDG